MSWTDLILIYFYFQCKLLLLTCKSTLVHCGICTLRIQNGFIVQALVQFLQVRPEYTQMDHILDQARKTLRGANAPAYFAAESVMRKKVL
jgi:hypothetical protein